MTSTPVVVIGFKRAAETLRVLESARRHHTGHIYVLLDGARPHGRDEEGCSRTQNAVQDFAAEHAGVTVRVSPENMGVARAIPAGIDWVFQEGHEDVIVLEDDCVPEASFFPYITHVLERYADDERVMMATGSAFLPTRLTRDWDASYYFSQFVHVWGWATWKRAWRHYDHEMPFLSDGVYRDEVRDLFWRTPEAAFYQRIWQHQLDDPHDSAWASRWLLAQRLHDGLCVVPRVNLVANIGFGAESTHTARASAYHLPPVRHLAMPLRDPEAVEAWREGDTWWFDHLISKRLDHRTRRYVARLWARQQTLPHEAQPAI